MRRAPTVSFLGNCIDWSEKSIRESNFGLYVQITRFANTPNVCPGTVEFIQVATSTHTRCDDTERETYLRQCLPSLFKGGLWFRNPNTFSK